MLPSGKIRAGDTVADRGGEGHCDPIADQTLSLPFRGPTTNFSFSTNGLQHKLKMVAVYIFKDLGCVPVLLAVVEAA